MNSKLQELELDASDTDLTVKQVTAISSEISNTSMFILKEFGLVDNCVKEEDLLEPMARAITKL